MNFQKVTIFNVPYAVVDYEEASQAVITKAQERESFGLYALPVHGLMESVNREDMAAAVQKADMIVPDGQPIRWAMNSFYKVGLKDRVYGPELTLHVLRKANDLGLKVFLYGGATQEMLDKFAQFIHTNYPKVEICGKYREDDPNGDTLSSETVNQSGAHLLLVGRGCPKQELWIARRHGEINAAMLAVGAAFAFHAGLVKQAPAWMQRSGLEWLFRLMQEPKRLFKRYLFTNTAFVWLFFKHKFILRRPTLH